MSSRAGQKREGDQGTPRPQDARRPRLAVFTHDTFGLGHVRRSTHILRALSEQVPDSSLLLVTGSPALHRLPSLPRNVDFVKVPTIVKTGSADRQPPHLHLGVKETTSLRERIIRETILGFEPDVFLVDNFPLGSRRELLPTLRALQDLPTRTVLGLRDILDTADAVRGNWERDGLYEVLADLYDDILVYGEQRVFDVASAYALPAETAEKLTYCGYLTDPRPVDLQRQELRRSLGVEHPFLVVTGGGGGDAFPLLETFLEAARLMPESHSLVLTGPLMNAVDRASLEERVHDTTRIQLKEFVPDVRPYLGAADAVVSMCGYNSATEILSQATRALVVPRTWQYGEHTRRDQVIAEGEQRMRAEALAQRGLVRMLPPEDLEPELMARELRALLRTPAPDQQNRPSLEGLANTTRFLARLLRQES